MWMLACEFTLIYSLTCLSLLRRALLLLPNAGEQGEGSGRGEKKTTPPPKKKNHRWSGSFLKDLSYCAWWENRRSLVGCAVLVQYRYYCMHPLFNLSNDLFLWTV